LPSARSWYAGIASGWYFPVATLSSPYSLGGGGILLVGHQLSFTGNRFRIQSKGGTLLWEGTYRVEPGAKPAAIDFAHTGGELKGKMWKGIYTLQGDTLTICDNAPNIDKPRPAGFEAKAGSGYVVLTFKRAKS